MDRASEAAARDLAEVRKLIEGMSAFVTSQTVQQQQQTTSQTTAAPSVPVTNATNMASSDRQPTPSYPTTPTSQPQQPQQQQSQQQPGNAMQQETAALLAAAAAAAAAAVSSSSTTPSTPAISTTNTNNTATTTTSTPQTNTSSTPAPDTYSTQLPTNGIVVQVDHLMFNRTLYFQLAPDATIEPLITGLRLSFNDNSISGMVLQYKGFDGLWKCLLNRDDSLKRILKQGFKSQTMLQMRVPREQDLLSSGYTDRRLLALTKPGA
ncbi:hypothetical protein INT45_000076 [Circinella minor]|uniref:Uncharacterized protein n=1 Tax=Circinella minor TaxID=1195481 RepID=A0A8H7SA81_9FUNG|nr:hypothetical protein INT45_000076 [Circinella minor]